MLLYPSTLPFCSIVPQPSSLFGTQSWDEVIGEEKPEMCVVFGGKSAVALWHVHHYYNFYALNAFNFTLSISCILCLQLLVFVLAAMRLTWVFGLEKKIKKTTGFSQMYCKNSMCGLLAYNVC